MPNALTPGQFEILHRLRDGIDLSSEPQIAHLLEDIALLISLDLVLVRGLFDVELSELGTRYLRAAEAEQASRDAPARRPSDA